MKRFSIRRSIFGSAGLVAAFLALGTPVVWGHGGNAQQIHACITNATGQVTVVADNTGFGNPNARCPRTNEQHALDWNVSGPAGPPGATGALGPQGPAGPQGPKGTSGASTELTVFKAFGSTSEVTTHGGGGIVAQVPVPAGTYLALATVEITMSKAVQAYCVLGHRASGHVLPTAAATGGVGPRSGEFYPHPNVMRVPFQALVKVPSRSAGSRIAVHCHFNDPAGAFSKKKFGTGLFRASIHALKISGAGK